MIKDVKYTGYQATPSDYESADGELSTAINLIQEDGGLRPIREPKVQFSVSADVRYWIHSTVTSKNYIWYDIKNSSLKFGWYPSTDALFEIPLQSTETFSGITAVNNFVIIGTTNNLHYFWFNSSENTYVYLGTKVPDIQLQFGLMSKFVMQDKVSDEYVTTIKTTEDDTNYGDLDEWNLKLKYSKTLNESDFTKTASSVALIYTSSKLALSTAPTLKKGIAQKLYWVRPSNQTSGVTSRIIVRGLYEGESDYTDLWDCEADCFDDATIEFEFTPKANITSLNVQLIIYPGSTGINVSFPILLALSLYSGLDSSESNSTDSEYLIKYDSDSFAACKAALNKFINEEATKKDYFLYPFFVRYAIVMFDGEIAYASSPALMIPNSGYVPAMYFDKDGNLTTGAFVSSLRGVINNAIPDGWKELISSIDIYVSSPMWTYKQGEEYDAEKNEFKFTSTTDSQTFGHAYYGDDAPSEDINFNQVNLSEYFAEYTDAYKDSACCFVKVSEMPEKEWRKQLESIAVFYKVASIDTKDLPEPKTLFDIELVEGSIATLATRPTLVEPMGYPSYSESMLTTYNKRLNIAPTHVGLPQAPQLFSCNALSGVVSSTNLPNVCAATVYLRSSYGERQVKSVLEGAAIENAFKLWYYYPDPNAYKVKIELYYDIADNVKIMATGTFDLTRHDFLSGSYVIGKKIGEGLSFEQEVNGTLEKPTEDIDRSLSIRPITGTIYYSKTYNPFCIANAITDVGQGKMLALATAAKPLSQGQFGAYPMYAFTNEGVWALKINDEGGYKAGQPITRDVCINADSITQIDSSVLFATDRGIMEIAGSTSTCISDVIDNIYTILDDTTLPNIAAIAKHAAVDLEDITLTKFRSYIRECGLVYDYVNQRIIVYNPSYTYAYVYSLKSKAWSTMHSDIAYHLNSYPEALAVTRYAEGSEEDTVGIIDLSATDSSTAKFGLIVTRPFKLDLPDVYKTIRRLMQRGVFRTGHVQQVLYGSNDLINWFTLASSSDETMRFLAGSPFKYFKLAVISNITAAESIDGFSADVTAKFTNRLR